MTSSLNSTKASSSSESKAPPTSPPESLLSETSLQLSLSPPRFPPYHTAQRSLHYVQDPRKKGLALHHKEHYQHVHRDVDLVHPWKKVECQRIHDLLVKIFHGGNYKFNKGGKRGVKGHSYDDNDGQIKGGTSTKNASFILPHPHLSPESTDQVTRYISSHILPLHLQNKYRDNGTFRTLSDFAITCSVPTLAVINPKAAMQFLYLSSNNVMKQIYYGLDHDIDGGNTTHESSSSSSSSQRRKRIDLFLPSHVKEEDVKGLVFFVHGGAWGSGLPWMYRLVATPFLTSKIAVAIIGYRTYPDGNAQDQVNDLLEAAQTLKRLHPKLWKNQHRKNKSSSSSFGVSLIGHSSGAHIGMLLLVQIIEKQINKHLLSSSSSGKLTDDGIQFDSYVGLSGVYNIQHHFDYEAGRGVEEISPMKPACGYSREAFDYYSPAIKLQTLLRGGTRRGGTGRHPNNSGDLENVVDVNMTKLIPPMLLLHGVEDDTVPFTSTSEAARIIKSCGAGHCSEYYMSKVGHSDVIMHFMLGGRSPVVVIDWLMNPPDESQVNVDRFSSKL